MTRSIRRLACSVVVLLVGTGCAGMRAPEGQRGPNGPNVPIPPQAVDLQRNIQFMLSFDEDKDGIVTRDELEAGLKFQRKTLGTKARVATVANINPPMTARPRGAFCSPLSPRPSAIGTIPIIMANAVIRTGRIRM